MGQIVSPESVKLPNEYKETLQTLQGEVRHHSKRILAAAVCDYDEFTEQINELNALCSRLTSNCGKRLLFGIKKGTDQSILWKATVRISIIHWDIPTATIVKSRLVNLPQFLQLFSTIHDQFVNFLPHSLREDSGSSDPGSPKDDMAFALILHKMLNMVDDNTNDNLNECCICLERKPDTMLPCAHAYCNTCIQQWNADHNSCPVCREKIETTDDGWVIPHTPGPEEITQEICSNLMNLASEP